MKKSFSSILYIIAILLISHNNGLSQNRGWSTTNPFRTDVFVENLGQFDNWAKQQKCFVINMEHQTLNAKLFTQ